MKRLLLIGLPLLLIVGCSKPINEDILYYDGWGIRMHPHKNEPYSGKAFSIYSNGQKEYELTYKDGILDGKWTTWYENGQKWYEEIYKDGEGLLTNSWDKNGKKTLKDGNGLHITWYENGQKKWEDTYKDGKQIENKRWTYYENGYKKDEEIWEPGAYNETTKTSWRYYENGMKKEEKKYKKGKVVFETDWYENGQKKRETTYYNGKEYEKKEWSYYENGQKEWERKFNIRNGLLTEWYENGKKKSEHTYVWNQGDPYLWSGIGWSIWKNTVTQNGPYTLWYENGQKRSEGTLKRGYINGIQTVWRKNEQGPRKRIIIDGGWDGKWYIDIEVDKDGNLISLKEWNEDGFFNGMIK